MPTAEEAPESLVDMGRQIAGTAQRLVHAEIGVVKARALEVVLRFAVGIGLLVAGLLSSLFFFIFTIGTLVEGQEALDSWPLYVAVGGAILGAALFVIGRAAPRWLSTVLTFLAVLSELLFVVGLVWFYVIAIIGDNGEIGRRGWAITGAVFFLITCLCLAWGGWKVWRGVRGTMDAVDDIKEDAAWVKQLTKRNASES